MFRNYYMINVLMNKKEFKNIIFKQFIDAPNVIINLSTTAGKLDNKCVSFQHPLSLSSKYY